jgi:hypothetical protein
MSTNPPKPGDETFRLPFDAPNVFDQAPAFTFAEDYNPLFPMGDTLPLEALDHLDPEETFDVLFGAPSADPDPAAPPIEDEPDLASMKQAKIPAPHQPLPLPPT